MIWVEEKESGMFTERVIATELSLTATVLVAAKNEFAVALADFKLWEG